jgi:mono/diheme cytochrome c family protein
MKSLIISAVFISFFASCGGNQKSKLPPGVSEKAEPVTYEQAVKDWRSNKGIGPVTEVKLGEVDPVMLAAGTKTFEINCTACHEPYKDKIGPALVGITERRTPEWIMNMMLNPEEMVKKDPICLGLLAKYNAIMANQRLSQEESRNILEYLRTLKIEG